MDEQLKRLNRVEFMVALVHIAANKFVRSGLLTDMSEAVSRLVEVHTCIQTHMHIHMHMQTRRRQSAGL